MKRNVRRLVRFLENPLTETGSTHAGGASERTGHANDNNAHRQASQSSPKG